MGVINKKLFSEGQVFFLMLKYFCHFQYIFRGYIKGQRVCRGQDIAAAFAKNPGNPYNFVTDTFGGGIGQTLLGGYPAPEGQILAVKFFISAIS